MDPINEWLRERAQAGTAAEVVADSLHLWGELAEIVAGLSDEQWQDPKLFSRLEGRSLASVVVPGPFNEHTHEHVQADVEPWLASHGRRS